MDTKEKIKIITRRLEEVVNADKIEPIVAERDLRIYWGTAPTGKPHLGYFVPMMKIADFLRAGCDVTILFANIHAYLDNMKSSWELLEKRTEFYKFVIKKILQMVGVSLEKLNFVTGTDFQLEKEYILDVYRLSAISTTRDTQRAGAEVVKQVKNPKMSSLLYPILQALDEVHLKVDAQFGGVDQRKIFMFAHEFLEKIEYEQRIHLMNPLIPGLREGKMSSSDPFSKIELDDSPATIEKKLKKASAVDGQIENNGVLAIAQHIVFPALENGGGVFKINRDEKWGGPLSFSSYEELEKAYGEKLLAAIDLKLGVSDFLGVFLKDMKDMLDSDELKMLHEEAYPPEVKPEKKNKAKNKGNRGKGNQPGKETEKKPETNE